MIEQFNSHRLRHGNLMDPGGIETLLGDTKVDLFYSDPPWGAGNLSYWSTMNKKMTGAVVTQPPLDDFLHRFFDVAASKTKEMVFVEYGLRWKDQIIAAGVGHGLFHLGYATPLYDTARPLHLHVFSVTPRETPPPAYFASIDGTVNLKTLQAALGPYRAVGKTILDPCCGLGFTAALALESGMTFYGNELNLARLQKTKAKLVAGTITSGLTLLG